MGLLDNLTFNPLLYGGQDGNLLDMLRSFQQTNDAYKPGAGFSLAGPQAVQPQQQDDPAALPANSQPTAGQNTIQVGDYSMPRIGFGSPLDANAQMPAPVASPSPAASSNPSMAATPAAASSLSTEPSFGDRLLAGFQSFANSKALLPALANGAVGFSTGQRADKTGLTLQGRNLTAQALVAKGVPIAQVQAALANPELMKQLISANFGNTSLTTDQRNAAAAAKDPKFAEFLEKQKSGGEKFGLSPMYGVDANGNPVAIQLSSKGGSQPVQLPDGVTISKTPIKLDTGTEIEFLDPITRQVIRRVPKDIAGAAKAKQEGEAAGKAAAAAPADIQAGNNALDIIKKIRDNPYLERGTGFSSMLNSVPGTGGYDFQNLVDQAKSGAFLQAIQQMRGLGSLSNAEGTAATAAINRMNTATSKEGFLDAVSDYEKVVKQGVARAQTRLSNPTATTIPPPARAAQGDPLGLR
jgi:hypothetical protein